MDPEIEAMSTIAKALGSLEKEAVVRVLHWASERYGVAPSTSSHRTTAEHAQSANTQPQSQQKASGTGEVATYSDFHELFDAANPSTSVDKALVAGYWFQVLKGQEDLDSQQLNKELKNLGHPSTNITRDLDSLINKTPRFVMQIRKDGSTKQARKKYKLTREGIKALERMLSRTE